MTGKLELAAVSGASRANGKFLYAILGHAAAMLWGLNCKPTIFSRFIVFQPMAIDHQVLGVFMVCYGIASCTLQPPTFQTEWRQIQIRRRCDVLDTQ